MKSKSKLMAFVASGIIVTAAHVSLAAEPMSEQEQVQTNLKRFDQLDFDAYSQRKDMKLFKEIHCSNVKVVFPDGRTTHGIEQHLKDIEGLFNGTPDSRVTSHPVSFGSGNWTLATGVLEATFTEPMQLPDGSSIPPTGKKVKLTMATVARWKNGCIAEEQLFWDNAEYMKQLGLGN